ncbi:nickel pincer cofactor biosynthesis protein LarC [Occallatibacter savannae]|uniref:nickel pincer cofactor biosynthesis protein LarC n=1 Tax=Occallatibacter savannae TaxID=1002691 RepID=UPI000D6978CE|nr:nickel pincer cofactor biosynthesis protein LarC [Occallatibacter savannae]
MRIAYLECFSGISGDMFLGALVDAGVPFPLLESTVAALNVGARLESRKVMRGGLSGTKIDVITEEHHEHEHAHPVQNHQHEHPHTHSHEHDHAHEHSHSQGHNHQHEHSHEHEHTHANETVHSHEHTHQPHRSLSAILDIIKSAPLSDSVKLRATRAFQFLGEAEARIHSMPVEQVHFHEVGAVDTIVDIVCAAVGAEHLKADRWLCSPLNVGSGTVNCAHGTLPVPAPATLALLGDAPIYSSGPAMERVTPTGAAILRMLEVEYTSLPALRVAATGYGAGGRDTPGQPNLLRLLVGEESAQQNAPESIAILETVIDDSSPQLIAYVSELLLEAGAWDVYRIPVQMKKGRTGVQLTVLCHPDRVVTLRDLLFRETTTIGLHWRVENKISLAREFKEVQTEWGPVRIKIARWPSGEVANAAPEYEDCRRLATEHSIPLKVITEQARRMFAAREEER